MSQPLPVQLTPTQAANAAWKGISFVLAILLCIASSCCGYAIFLLCAGTSEAIIAACMFIGLGVANFGLVLIVTIMVHANAIAAALAP